MRIYLLFLGLLFFSLDLTAQSGCTDPQASNYDASATSNDGSCLYPITDDTLDLIAELPIELVENSGLVVTPLGLFTHNDKGNPNEIYRIDTIDGSVLQTLLVVGDNEDWEDMAESESHIFLGDFGNNPGDRTDLRIYRIAKSELSNNIINAQPINFAYADQVDFSDNQNNHNFDCEAFFYHDDSLHLFTKNWVDHQTKHYVIPAEPGFYSVLPRHNFDVDGLITSADINEDGTILLLGYTQVGFTFMWMLFDYPGNEIFSGNKRRIELRSWLFNSQTEAIAFKDKYTGYVSSEQLNLGPAELPPKLMSFDIAPWFSEVVSTADKLEVLDVKLFPNPFTNQLNIRFPDNWPLGETEVRLRSVNGFLLLREKLLPSKELTITVNNDWPAGIYIVELLNEEGLWQKRVIKH